MFEVDLTNLHARGKRDVCTETDRREAAEVRVEKFRREKWSTFFELVEPAGQVYLREIQAAAADIQTVPGLKNFVNVGIGGSALGGEAVLRALLHPLQNERGGGRGHLSRFYFPDNVDPETNAALLETLDPRETLVHIASKSGATAETAAQMMVFVPWLEKALGEDEARKRIVVSTDPEKGDLRALVTRKRWRAISIPPGVGGRFSVFGSVGLLPLALFGCDPAAFLAGAAAVAEHCRGTEDNPALDLAMHLHAQHVDEKRNVLVLMSYSDSLAPVGDWFGQLWGESLGKNAHAGSSPVRAVGATDQHSQLQLFMEGPDDKVVLFLRTRAFRTDVMLPPAAVKASSTDYLEGKGMAELLTVESLATEKALTDAGRPNAALVLERIDERTLGALLYYLQLVTVYAGALYDVNPFDQPGVEAGKKLTYGYFGRPGFEAEGQALRDYMARPRKTTRVA
jgi:glucose-6-phosphate isomerase